ncbi:autotransporter domain-containing protein [Xylella fastidiosa]|uniref:autotransporter domain-containing protein n=1 Tax=Xylella fastidiosa TaxID=2371 RepID=UPI00249D929A|nr:autotransporter domain-containing protein [Xylella fastidiosa]WGZ33695.1 autotransporter domain-containing protein [Xylella fastidiosa subsp. pauca]
MERKNHKKTTLATLISVLLMGGAGATYANSASISEKLDLATQHLDGAASSGQAISSDGKTIATSSNNRAFLLSGDNWATKTELGSLKSDSSGTSSVLAFSSDGKIAAGQSSVDSSSTQLQATIWSGDNWATKTKLGTLKSDNSGETVINALSADGKVAAGASEHDSSRSFTSMDKHGIIWSGNNWATKTDLGTLKSSNFGISSVNALSADGTIAVGHATSDINTPLGINSFLYSSRRAVVWSGNNWATKTDLGTLRKDNFGEAEALALSVDGKVIGGASNYDYLDLDSTKGYSTSDTLAIIWSGDNWGTKTNLGSLKRDNSGPSTVNALSADGSIAGGAATNDANAMHAIIWSGNNWATKTDLGTLKSDNSGESTVSALSADGSVAVGTAATDAGSMHATVWKITYPAQSNTSTPSTPSTPSQPSVVKVDADNTKTALSRLGAETFSVMDLQRQGLTRLQQHCQIDAAGQSCWAVQTAISSIDGNRDKVAGIKLGHGFTETFSAGLSLDRSLSRSLPDSYLKNKGNLGAGLYAQWNTAFHGSQWYVRPAVAFNRYNVTVQRPVLENTEAGIGTSRMKGRGASLEAGQTFKSDHGVLLGWHLGGRYNNVSRTEYSEQNAAFPTTYGEASFKRTSAYLGADATIPLTTHLKWMAAVEIDRALKNRDAVYSAQANYIGNFNHRIGIKGTIATLSSGLQYTISEKILLGLTLDVNQTAFGDIARGGTLSVGGRF